MLTAFDVGVGVLVLISAILAMVRGLTREVLSLATWAGSAAIAGYLVLYQPTLLNQYFSEELIAKLVLGGGSFLIALVVLHLITMQIADWVVDSRVGPLDRTLGFVFGVARGLLIAVIFVVFAGNLLNLESAAWAGGSKSWPLLRGWGEQLMSVLPPDAEQWFSELLQRGKTAPEVDAPNEQTPDVPDDIPATPGGAQT